MWRFLVFVILISCFHPVISKNNRASVATNGAECAKIGKDMIRRKGSAADAAIAVSFCEMVSIPHLRGIGGAFTAAIYDHKTGKVTSLIAQARAPIKAYKGMFDNRNITDWQVGGLSIAVPGELKGLHALHDKYGVLPWEELVKPTIKLCRDGVVVSKIVDYALNKSRNFILGEETLRAVFVDPNTKDVYKKGDRIKHLKLAETLEIIGQEKSDAIHAENGSLIDDFVKDIENFGGIITKQDMIDYKPLWRDSISFPLPNNQTLYTTPAPSSGPILAFIMNIMSGYPKEDTGLFWHRVMESFKFAYAQKPKIGDPDFVDEKYLNCLLNPSCGAEIRKKINDSVTFNTTDHYGLKSTFSEDHGTANIAVIGLNGDAVSLISTTNHYFGSQRRSPSTGIILNDEMDDFSSLKKANNNSELPPSEASFIDSRKMPPTSMTPVIILGPNQTVDFVIGAAGATKIPSSVAHNIIRHLWLNETIEDTIKAKRIHHQLIPNQVELQTGFDKNIIKDLKNRGHKVKEIDGLFTAIVAIDGVRMVGVYDPVRGGSVENMG